MAFGEPANIGAPNLKYLQDNNTRDRCVRLIQVHITFAIFGFEAHSATFQKFEKVRFEG